jgi:hypothetical protein
MSSQLQEPHRKLKKSSAVSLRDERADTPISLALEFGFVLAKITTQIVSHRDYSRRFAFRTSPPVLRFSFCRPLNIASTRTGLAIALNPVVPTMRNRDGGHNHHRADLRRPGIDCV